MLFFDKVVSICCLMQVVIAGSSPNHKIPEDHKMEKRDLYPMSSNYQGSSYPPNYQSSPHPPNYQGSLYPPNYQGYQQNYTTPTQSCDCTQNCDFDTRPCTKDDHPTGCTVQDCTAADTVLLGYTCFCDSNYPGGCVFPNLSGQLQCQDDTTSSCLCNGISKSPTDCTLDVCKVNEKPTCTTRCICHPTDHTLRPCGCVTGVIDTGDMLGTSTLAAEVKAILAEQNKEEILKSAKLASASSSPFLTESNDDQETLLSLLQNM